jgi:ubiquitin-protein ligase
LNARLRRLAADYEKIRNEFAGHPNILVEPLSGNPPERYRITYKVKGLRLDPNLMRPVITNLHRSEIYLHSDYPREKPKCVMLTEIFHPNFGSYICIGDHWAAGESLADVIVQIGEMIQYQSYNPKSPLNAQAAVWSHQNRDHLPVGNVNLYQPEPDILLDVSEDEDDLDITLG